MNVATWSIIQASQTLHTDIFTKEICIIVFKHQVNTEIQISISHPSPPHHGTLWLTTSPHHTIRYPSEFEDIVVAHVETN